MSRPEVQPAATVRVVVYIDDMVEYDHSEVVPKRFAERVAYHAYVQVQDPNLDDD